MLLEQLIELNEESEKKSDGQGEAKKEAAEREKQQALEMRARAI